MSGAQDGKIELVKVALEKGGLKPETLNSALRRASAGSNKEIVELLKKAGAAVVEVSVEPEILKTYVGVYKNEQVGELTVEIKDGKLVGKLAGQGSFTTTAVNKNTFSVVEVEATITFNTEAEWGTASSPIIYKNMVIVQCDVQKNSFIAAYDLRNGKEVWRTPREEIPSWGTPTIYEGPSRVELITNATRAIRAYDPMTGKELWRMTGNPEVTATTPIFGHGLIFICNSYRPNQPIYAIRAGATGDISLKPNETTNQHIAWSMQRGGTYMPTPLIYGEYLYTCANQGVMACYNPKTGERLYQQRIGDKGGSYSASPVAADGKIYLSSEDGEIFVVKTGREVRVVSYKPDGRGLDGNAGDLRRDNLRARPAQYFCNR